VRFLKDSSATSNCGSPQPVQHEQEAPVEDAGGLYGDLLAIDPRARLVDRPKKIDAIVGGMGLYHKPAKDSKTAEKGNKMHGTKQKYYRRMIVWKTQCRLVDGGRSVMEANTLMAQVACVRTVTKTMDKLIALTYKNDLGVHPSLRKAP
jgi:hypothetical protein